MTAKKPTFITKGKTKIILHGPSIKDGREVWHVSLDGQKKSVSTSATSSMAMNEAMRLYSGALKRLADK